MNLKDKSLLREQCFVGGQWIGTPGIAVSDPAIVDVIAEVPRFGTAETPFPAGPGRPARRAPRS